MRGYLEKKRFCDININDSFFDSLKSDYQEFEDWFKKKAESEALLLYDNGHIQGFLYMKVEDGIINEVIPVIDCKHALKIGTFKINPHGTRLGERFIKKALDFAVSRKVDCCYVTIFEKHSGLMDLLMRYGFVKHGVKQSSNGTEFVLIKSLKILKNDILLDYPLISMKKSEKYILSIYPRYHSVMFPDSLLKNESIDILEDVSYTNSIHKIYVSRMLGIPRLKYGDIVVIYRTKPDNMKTAEYTSVVTSVCIVEEVRKQNGFKDFEEFYSYASTYSIFDKDDLNHWYNKGGCYTIKMTYNAALSKRLTRHKLIEEFGIERDTYYGVVKLTNEQFSRILEEGGVSESLIID